MVSFTDEIRRAVAASELTCYAISKRLGIPESSMSHFMHGKGLSFENLDALAALLGLHVTTGRKAGAKRTTRHITRKRRQRATKGR